MKSLLFSPHGFARQEGGLALAVLGYLRPQMNSLQQVSCFGTFSQCGRDSGEERPIRQCFECQDDQEFIADWLDSERLDLAEYLSPEDIKASSEFVSSIPEAELENFELEGLPLGLVLRSSPSRSVLVVQGRRSRRDELVDALRFLAAAEHMLIKNKPDVIFATGVDDFMNVLFEGMARRLKIQLLRFRTHADGRSCEMVDSRSGRASSSELLLRHLGFVPRYHEEWPEGLRTHIEEILLNLELIDPQLSLQLDATGT